MEHELASGVEADCTGCETGVLFAHGSEFHGLVRQIILLLFRAQGGRYMLDRCDRPAIKSVMADLRLGMDTHDAWVKVGQLSLLLNRSLTLFRRMWRIVRIS